MSFLFYCYISLCEIFVTFCPYATLDLHPTDAHNCANLKETELTAVMFLLI